MITRPYTNSLSLDGDDLLYIANGQLFVDKGRHSSSWLANWVWRFLLTYIEGRDYSLSRVLKRLETIEARGPSSQNETHQRFLIGKIRSRYGLTPSSSGPRSFALDSPQKREDLALLCANQYVRTTRGSWEKMFERLACDTTLTNADIILAIHRHALSWDGRIYVRKAPRQPAVEAEITSLPSVSRYVDLTERREATAVIAKRYPKTSEIVEFWYAADESVDVIVIDSLHLIEDNGEFIKRAEAILRPGGRLIVIHPTIDDLDLTMFAEGAQTFSSPGIGESSSLRFHREGDPCRKDVLKRKTTIYKKEGEYTKRTRFEAGSSPLIGTDIYLTSARRIELPGSISILEVQRSEIPSSDLSTQELCPGEVVRARLSSTVDIGMLWSSGVRITSRLNEGEEI